MSAAGLPRSRPHPRLLHAHPDFVEALLIDEGSARFLIGDHAYEVRAGDLLVFNSGVVHDELSDSPFGSWCIAVGGLRLPGLLENALIPENAAPVHPMGRSFRTFGRCTTSCSAISPRTGRTAKPSATG